MIVSADNNISASEGAGHDARPLLEELGPNQVRTMMSSGNIPMGWNVAIIMEWLAGKDQEEKRLNASSLAEQTEIARVAAQAVERAAAAAERASDAAERQAVAAERAAVAAERANTRATIALATAAISIAATIVGIVITHLDDLRSVTHP
jgi:uncharacterized protein (DUF1697 family)